MLESRSIQGIIVLALGIITALWLGTSLVTNQTETVMQFTVVALLLTCVFLGRKIWLLAVFFSVLDVPVIRGFGTLEIGRLLFIGFTLLLFLMRKQPLRFKFTELELWLLLVAACIFQTYVRNPVGLNMFGAGSVGARPYFLIAVAFLFAALLSNLVVPAREIKWAFWLSVVGGFLGIALNHYRMGLGSETRETTIDSVVLGHDKASGRIGTLASLGIHISKIVIAFVSPLRGMLHPFWFPMILFSLAAAAGSGFRNTVAAVGIFYLIGILYRGGFASFMISCFSAIVGLALLALVNLAMPLPPNVQRALSPFPGTWDKRQVQQAEASTEWRVEMWKEALFTEYWIHNKIFGDGMGLSSRELEMLHSLDEGGGGIGTMGSSLTNQQVAMMITGGYHSAPVETIRAIGYVGLFCVMILMIRVAVHAHRQILRCRGTEWYPVALFFFIPTIALPFIFTLIVGGFGVDVASTFTSYAMVRLFEKNLPLPAYVPRHRHVYVPVVVRNRAGEVQTGRGT